MIGDEHVWREDRFLLGCEQTTCWTWLEVKAEHETQVNKHIIKHVNDQIGLCCWSHARGGLSLFVSFAVYIGWWLFCVYVANMLNVLTFDVVHFLLD